MPTIIPSLPTAPTVTPLTASVIVPSNDWVPYTIGAGETLYATSLQTLLQASGAGYVSPLTNNGTMWNEVGASPYPNSWLAWHATRVVNNGLLVLHVSAGLTVNAMGFEEADFDNSGQLFVVNEGVGNATGIDSYVGGSFVNSGLVAVQALNGFAVGYSTNNESTFDNQAGAQLLVEGMGAIAFATANGSHSTSTTINNAGTIRAVSLDPDQASVALLLGGYSVQRFAVTNSGTIDADIAIYGADDTATTMGTVQQQIYNLAGGQVTGLIYLQRGNDLVDNDGTINGDIYMGEGADAVDNRAGTINGITDLGWGNDIFWGGNGADFAGGGRDNDNMEGGGGNDQLMGGGGDDLLIGGGGNDGLFGEWGNDRIVTAGGDYVDGGDGNDRIELGDYTFEYVSGGDGFDTLVLPGPGGVRTINLSAALAEGAFSDIEKIELTGGKTLIIQGGDVATLTGGETSLFLATTVTDRVQLVGAWTRVADQTVDGVVYKTYTSGSNTILVSGTGVISTNATSEPGALDPFAGGELAPVPGGSPLGFTSHVEIWDRYELTAPITIQEYETFHAGPSGTLFVDWVGTSVTNYGTIESIGQSATPFNTNNIENIFNHGTIRAEATSSWGVAVAIQTDSFANIENDGLIIAWGRAGAIGIETYDLLNRGTIDVRALQGSALGVSTWNGAVFENHGLLSAWSGGPLPGDYGSAATGVDFYNQVSAINSGTIIATADRGFAMAVRAYVEFRAMTLTNTGTIEAVSLVPDEFPTIPDEVAVRAYIYHANGSFRLVNSGDILGTVLFDGQGTFNVQNSGLIDGDILYGVAIESVSGNLQMVNSGLITGAIDLRIGLDVVNIQNDGQIGGAITLGIANDIFDGRLGTQSGPISGGGGNDTIRGGIGADTMSGNAGIDLLSGGAGADTFRDAASEMSGDTINDFSAADRIVLTDASLAGFAFNLAGSTLTYTGGSLTLTNGFSGTLVASAAIGGGVQLSVQSLVAVNDVRNDFNGDGRSDILWRNVDGQLSNWLGLANGGFTPNNTNAAAVVPTDWQVVGTGDFNGDGRDDILWRHTSGTLSNWLGTANGGYTPNDANAAAAVPTDWHVVGTGDFNGDGRDDILWRNNDGTLSNWLGLASGGFTPNDANAAAPVPTAWFVAGTGDFNGDGRDDILWRNVDGQLSNWLGTASGGFTPNNANAAAAVPTDWLVIGTGDFNGDGRDDILWRNTNGTLSNWLGTANGGYTPNDANAAALVPIAWTVVAIGDYNGDGRDDILWRHTDGTLSNWLGTAAGGFTPNDANAAAPVPTAWHVQPEPFLL